MADAITLQSRPVCCEDFIDPSNPNATFAQVTYPVLGLGSVLVTPLVNAASDVAAAAAGVPVGGMYVNNGGSFNYLRTRMS